MANDFTVGVPLDGLNFGGGGGNSDVAKKSQKELEELNDNVKQLDKDVLLTVDIIEVIGSLFQDALRILQPILKMLSLLGFVLLLPLLPLVKTIVERLADFIKFIAASDLQRLGNAMNDVVTGIALLIGFVFSLPNEIFKFFRGIGEIIFGYIMSGFEGFMAIGQFLAENIIIPAFMFLSNIGSVLWDQIIFPGFFGLANIGQTLIDTIILPGFSFLSNIGSMIWDGIKGGFNYLKDAVRKVANGIITLINKVPGISIPRLAEGGIVTQPTLALIGEAGPEAVVPLNNRNIGGGGTINIYHPVVRSQADIRELTTQISRLMKRNMNGRVSA